MTDTERLLLRAAAAQLELGIMSSDDSRLSAHIAEAGLVIEQIYATLDSVTADEIDALK
jgi:hypothetical protein